MAAPIYKWVDEAGNTHYSDQAPAEKYESEELVLLSRANAYEARKSQEKLVRLQQRLKRDQDRRLAAREEKRLQIESDQALRTSRLRRCLDAQYQLHDLETQVPVYYMSEKGNRVFLGDEERAEYMRYYRSEINTFCD